MIPQDSRIWQHYGIYIGERFDERCIRGLFSGIQRHSASAAGRAASQTIQCKTINGDASIYEQRLQIHELERGLLLQDHNPDANRIKAQSFKESAHSFNLGYLSCRKYSVNSGFTEKDVNITYRKISDLITSKI